MLFRRGIGGVFYFILFVYRKDCRQGGQLDEMGDFDEVYGIFPCPSWATYVIVGL
jgi:hypothetical protein